MHEHLLRGSFIFVDIMNNLVNKSNIICFVAFTLRIFLLLFGNWQDSKFDVKFTDVDYYVFSDASDFVTKSLSPYLRGTYRYTPLLAWILQPNYFLEYFGKLVFIISDILTGTIIQKILTSYEATKLHVYIGMSIWLFNPLTCTISCRGNAESIMALLLNALLLALMKKCSCMAGCLFALAIHVKIYPVIYTLALFIFLGNSYDNFNGSISFSVLITLMKKFELLTLVKKVFTFERMNFFISMIFTLTFLNLVMFNIYGYEFLEHTYLYHVSRSDIKHNFSIFFYMLYLSGTWWQSLICFVVQVLLILVISSKFSSDLPFTFFLLTISFVTFNKVATSQYFIWYLSFIPVLVPGFRNVKVIKLLSVVSLWMLGQMLWLYEAYKLEFQAHNSYLEIWLSAALFFIINIFIIVWCIDNYLFFDNFDKIGKLRRFKLTN